MNQTEEIVVGVTVGVAGGIILSLGLFFALRCFLHRSSEKKKKMKDEEQITSEMPMRMNDVLAAMDSLDSMESISELPAVVQRRISPHVLEAQTNAFASASGIPRYSYKDIEKSTHNFTTIVGKGSFGSVYKAEMPNGAVVAVKVLAANSRQGEKEFQTEVLLLSKLHHRNLVNLIGFCVEKGQFMLVYEFMSNGSLANHLYGTGVRSLTWEERVNVALDVSRGIQYLHEGTVPPVIHRDLKSANILLDGSLTAKKKRENVQLHKRLNRVPYVADFGLSKQGMGLSRKPSGLKGTYGYIDPDYVLTNVTTTKSDVYSFGIIIFELITAINPQQGLLEYINLAVAGGDGNADWDEILDKRLVGNCDLRQLQLIADLAYACLHKVPRKRPSISEIADAIAKIKGQRSSHVIR